MNILQASALGIAGLVLISASLGSVVSVDQGTVHTVYRFGEVQEQTLTPGLNFVVPYITSTKPVDVSTKALPESFESLTSDGQKIKVTATVTFNTNAAHLSSTARSIILTGDKDKDNNSIVSIALTPPLLAAVKEVISEKTMSQIINDQAGTSQEIVAKINASLAKQSIVSVQNLVITGLVLDPDVQAAIEKKAIALQEQEAATIKVKTAEILAEQNNILTKSLTPQILQQQAITKWDGHTLVFNAAGSGNTPVILQAPSTK